MTALHAGLDFQLPDELSAREPPEARGLARDDVRLMVSHVNDNTIAHTRFSHLPDLLVPGDVLVVNTSATINAALPAMREAARAACDGDTRDVMLHLSTPLFGEHWVVELRRRSSAGTTPLLDAEAGERLRLPAGGMAELVEPYAPDGKNFSTGHVRLWIAALRLPNDALTYTARHGSPIRYAYVPKRWGLSYYQAVFSNEPGSAEMPSAGRAFTRTMLDRLARDGVRIAPLVLHAGVSSLESDESPYPERYSVPRATAQIVNSARALGSRIIAVGTTAVRAIETVASDDGEVRPDHGWTDLVVTPERGLRVVNAILTGLHAPNASHLSMLEALASRDHLALAYGAALRHRYLWHEFGDLHLILP
jgi:S-adenosylmethionine:tRNA ribosyltransferase-isomerase